MEEGEGTNVAGCFLDQETPKKCNAGVGAATANASTTTTSQSATCFDCSICLDCAVEPVVTLCGHLYCRGCICEWLRVKTAASPPRCPVCRAPVSENAVVPLYGRGRPTSPNRPDVRPIVPRQQEVRLYRHRYDHDHCYTPQWGAASVFSSTAGGVLGGLVFDPLRPLTSSRNDDYVALRPYQLVETGGSRQELLVAESLHEIWVFLLCCAVLCLVYF